MTQVCDASALCSALKCVYVSFCSFVTNALISPHLQMGDAVETMLSKNKGWRAPFALVFLLLVGMVVAVIQQYRKLMRSNYIGAYR